MRFDDRLTTVLAQSASDPRDRCVRWRQLVDLVARAAESQSPLIATALEEIAAEAPHVEEAVRAGAARSIAALDPPLALVALFAGDTAQVAAPLLTSVDVDDESMRRLFDAASPENRRILEALRPGATAESRAPERTPESRAESSGESSSDAVIPSISDLVERIDRLRSERHETALDTPRPAEAARASEPVAAEAAIATASRAADSATPAGPPLFRWECSPSGEIAWVDGAPRGALIGRSLAQPSKEEGVDPAIPQAFARRAAFHDATLTLAGDAEIAGEWKISGAPAFEPLDGRFAGYRGIAMRARAMAEARGGGIAAGGPDHDSIRELVHELKTPLNAIVGFAEIIDGEYFGPANDRYRARAAEIVAQARLLVAAIDDVDLAARLQSGREPPTEPVRVGQLFGQLASELRERAVDRGSILEIDDSDTGATCAIHPGIAEQLVRRFCEAAIDLAEPGERIEMKLQMLRDRCSLLVAMPRALRGHDAEELLAGAPARAGDEEPDPFFWLRLVRGLARLTGGELMTADGSLSLILPKA